MAPPSDRKRSFLLRSAVITSAALLTFCKKTNDDPIVYANPKGPTYEPTLDASTPLDSGASTPEASAPPVAHEDAAVLAAPDASVPHTGSDAGKAKAPDAGKAIAPPPRILHANPKGSLYDKGNTR